MFTPTSGPQAQLPPQPSIHPQPVFPKKETLVNPESAMVTISIAVDTLPSKGRAYPDGATLSYRPYTFGEIKKVAQSKFEEVEYLNFVRNGIITDFDPLLLTLADLGYLGLLRKISSLGKGDYAVKSDCPNCNKEITTKFDLTQIDFDDLKTELPVIFDLDRDDGSKLEFYFSPITLGDFFALRKIKKEEDLVALMAMCCRNMPFVDCYNILSSFTLEEAEYINEIDALLYHGVKPLTTACNSCDFEHKIKLEVSQVLVLPFRGDKGTSKGRIRSSVQAPH